MGSILKDYEKKIFAAGFLVAREAQGHVVYRHPDGRTFSMPDPGRPKALGNNRGSNGLQSLRQMLRRNGIPV